MWFGRLFLELSLDTRSLPRYCLKQRYSARLDSRLYLKFFLLFKEPGNPLRRGSFSLFAYCRYFLAMCFNRFFCWREEHCRPPDHPKMRKNDKILWLRQLITKVMLDLHVYLPGKRDTIYNLFKFQTGGQQQKGCGEYMKYEILSP